MNTSPLGEREALERQLEAAKKAAQEAVDQIPNPYTMDPGDPGFWEAFDDYEGRCADAHWSAWTAAQGEEISAKLRVLRTSEPLLQVDRGAPLYPIELSWDDLERSSIYPVAREELERREAWISRLQDPRNAWLLGEVEPLLRRGGLWNVALAVGRFGRHRAFPPDQGRRFMESFMRGVPEPEWQMPWVWFSALQERGLLAEMSAGKTALLQSLLQSLLGALERPTEYPKAWGRIFFTAMRMRDDLESVLVFGLRPPPEVRVRKALDRADAIGIALVDSLGPREPKEWKEQTWAICARANAPEAWWAGGEWRWI